MSRRTGVLGCGALTAAATAILIAAPSASANVSAALPFGTYSDTLVDAAHGHVFISGRPSNIDTPGPGGVEVTDALGGNAQTVAGISDGGAMAMAPDGSAVYVVTPGEIDAIDTVALTVTAFPTTGIGCVHDIAATTGYIWVAYACDSSNSPLPYNIAAIKLSDKSVALSRIAGVATGWLAMDSVAGASDLVAVLTSGDDTTPTRLTLYSAANGTLAVGAAKDLGNVFATALALSHDGSRVVVGGNFATTEYSTSDLSTAVRTFPTPQGVPVSVGFSDDGATVAVAASYWWSSDNSYEGYGTALTTFREATASVVRTYDFRQQYTQPDVINEVHEHGLAWSGNSVLLTLANYLDERPTLHTLSDAVQAPSAMTLTGPSTAKRAAALSITGTLTAKDGPIAAASISVTKTDMHGSHTLVSVATVGSGSFTIHDTPAIGGTNTYTATFAGDAKHARTSKSIKITVSRVTPSLSITPDHTKYHWGQTAYVTVHLGTTYHERTVSIYEKITGGSYRLLKSGTVSTSGGLKTSYKVSERTTFQVRFAGDERYAPKTVSATRQVSAVIATTLASGYGLDGTYHLFHQSAGGYIKATVHPAKMGSVTFRLQVHQAGAWRDVDVQAFPLDSLGRSGLIGFIGSKGYDFRIRGETGTRTVNGIAVNTAATGSWYYVRFTT